MIVDVLLGTSWCVEEFGRWQAVWRKDLVRPCFVRALEPCVLDVAGCSLCVSARHGLVNDMGRVRARPRCGIRRPDLAWHCSVPTGSVRVGLGRRVREMAYLLAAQGTLLSDAR